MAIVVGELATKLLCNSVHSGARRSDGNSRFETRHHIQIVAAAIASFCRVRLERQRPPEIYSLSVRGSMKITAHVQHSWRHNADHGKRLSGKLQGFADDIRVSLEVRSPEPVTQDDHVIVVLEFLFFVEVASDDGVISKHAEVFMRDRHSR